MLDPAPPKVSADPQIQRYQEKKTYEAAVHTSTMAKTTLKIVLLLFRTAYNWIRFNCDTAENDNRGFPKVKN